MMSVRLEIADDVATVLLDRPAKRNALNEQMLGDLLAAVAQIRTADEVSVVVVRSSSPAFCAGADIKDWDHPGAAKATRLALLGHEAFTGLAALPQPSIAVLAGPVMGGGLELALACDLRVAAPDARLAFPEARLGNLPSWGGLPRLVDAVGSSRARQMLLTGREISGADAAAWGLCAAVASDDGDDLDRVASELTRLVAGCDRTALALVKAMVPAAAPNASLEAALAVYTGMLPGSAERKQAFFART
jgi:enoyl-CoA hydratase/carnithine racemase